MTQEGFDQASMQLTKEIKDYLNRHNLNASLSDVSYEILALQLMDSVEHENQIKALADTKISNNCCNPNGIDFDPIKAIIFLKDSDYDEACWLSFLLIYTDDSAQNDWPFMRLLYGAIGLDAPKLTWQVINEQPELLNQRLERLVDALVTHQPKPKFGHHRSYESLSQLPTVFASYKGFINEQGGHQALFKPHENNAEVDKTAYFQTLYPMIRQNVYRFGRLSTFEFLCLLGKMGLADVEPDSCYIAEASGPKRGAQLLFGMLNNTELDAHAVGLADYLEVGYQAMEAAICHWQKSPNRYIPH